MPFKFKTPNKCTNKICQCDTTSIQHTHIDRLRHAEKKQQKHVNTQYRNFVSKCNIRSCRVSDYIRYPVGSLPAKTGVRYERKSFLTHTQSVAQTAAGTSSLLLKPRQSSLRDLWTCMERVHTHNTSHPILHMDINSLNSGKDKNFWPSLRVAGDKSIVICVTRLQAVPNFKRLS